VATGVARGIGAATADRLRREGARVTWATSTLRRSRRRRRGGGVAGLGVDVTTGRSQPSSTPPDGTGPARRPDQQRVMPIGPFPEELDDVARRLFDVNVTA
jgi:NAD(P)-dependent dehydrogenase (short-subunit alcohol dehydrogenase family)